MLPRLIPSSIPFGNVRFPPFSAPPHSTRYARRAQRGTSTHLNFKFCPRSYFFPSFITICSFFLELIESERLNTAVLSFEALRCLAFINSSMELMKSTVFTKGGSISLLQQI